MRGNNALGGQDSLFCCTVHHFPLMRVTWIVSGRFVRRCPRSVGVETKSVQRKAIYFSAWTRAPCSISSTDLLPFRLLSPIFSPKRAWFWSAACRILVGEGSWLCVPCHLTVVQILVWRFFYCSPSCLPPSLSVSQLEGCWISRPQNAITLSWQRVLLHTMLWRMFGLAANCDTESGKWL